MTVCFVNNSTAPISISWKDDLVKYFALFCAITLTFLCVFGVIGNALSIVVFLQKHFRNVSINLFLIALSLADLVMIVMGIPVFVTAPLLTYKPSLLHHIDYLYAFSSIYFYPVASIARCSSIWLLVAVTIERWAAVCRPFIVTIYFTRKRALLAIGFIFVLAFTYNFATFWEFTFDDDQCLQPLLRTNHTYILWKLTVADLTVTYLTPLIIVVTLNSLTARELIRSDELRSKMSAAQSGDRKTAKMFIYVILMFVICYSLSLALNIYEVIVPDSFDSDIGVALTDFNNILAVLNSATTWIFYLRFSTRYRDMVKYLLFDYCYGKLFPSNARNRFHSFVSSFRIQSFHANRQYSLTTYSTTANDVLDHSRIRSASDYIKMRSCKRLNSQNALSYVNSPTPSLKNSSNGVMLTKCDIEIILNDERETLL